MAVTQNTYTGNGATVLYSFTFPYLETTDVKVTINGTPTTAYTFANATTIQFNTAPANGAAIRIYRDTDDASLAATFYSGSAIRAQDLNDNFTQNLYVTQEVNNNSVNIDGSNPMVGPLNMNGFQITNLPVPAVDTNAATKKYVDDRFGNLDIPGHTRWRKVATASQTTFSGTGDYGGVLAYSPTREQVYINGALQQRGVDYAADNGTSVIFTVGLTVGDVVDIICVNNLTNSAVSNAANITYSGQFTGQTARTVAAKLTDVVSVLDFGADPTGQTDSTGAIQAAANAVSSGGFLDFGNKKTYKITATIQLNAGVSVLGNGSKLLCYECDGLTYPPLPIGGGGTREINFLHVQIENLQFENLTETLSDYVCARDAAYSGIRIVDSAGIFIKNCRFFSFHRGIWLTGCQLVSVQSCYFWRCWLGYKTFGDPNGAPHGIGPSTQADGHSVERNFFDQCVYPIYITGYGANQGPITVERNYCFAPTAALANDNFYMRVGIILESAKGASVSYNTFDAYTVYNNYKANNANFTFVPNTACILVDYHTADAYLTEANILGTPPRNGGGDQDIAGITIQGNSLRSMGYGVLIKHALGVQITANDFQDLTSKGVRSFDNFNSGLSLNNYWFGWESLSPAVDEYDLGFARFKIAEPYRNQAWRSDLEPTNVTTQRGVASGGSAGDITVTFPVRFTTAPFIQLTVTGNPPAGSSVYAFLRSWSDTSMVIGRQNDNGTLINDAILDVMWEATGPTY